MKSKFIIQLIAALGGAWLCYNAQGWGINVFIICLAVAFFTLTQKITDWQQASLLSLAGLLIALYGNSFSIWMFMVAILLVGSTARYDLKLPLALLNGTQQLVTNGWRFTFSNPEKTRTQSIFNLRNTSLLILPLIITTIFYLLYCSASDTFAEKLDFSFLNELNWSFVILSCLFLYLSYGLFYSLNGAQLYFWQQTQPDILVRIRRNFSGITNPFFLKWEYQTAVIALVCLNLLLLAFHFIDLDMVLANRPEKGVHLQKLLHQGVYALILSIVLAISLLLYVFRGNLNFFSKNKTLKQLTYLWILQNAWLALTTAQKNMWYVTQFGLTWKRIGVWIYLTLVLVGLVLTWLKIRDKKTLWWLVKRNVQIAITVLFIMATAPWTRIITWYNINEAQVTDFDYLLNLSIDNTDQLSRVENRMSSQQADRLYFREKELQESTEQGQWKNWTLTNQYSYAQLQENK